MLDTRLYPLLETLTNVDLDWLAEEIVAGVLSGRMPEEAPERLAEARSMVFRSSQDGDEFKPVLSLEEQATALSGKEQVMWAAAHVGQRIEQVLAMSRTSLGRLDNLVEFGGKAVPAERTSGATLLVINEGEAATEVSQAQLDAAVEGLTQLRTALKKWAAQVTAGDAQ